MSAADEMAACTAAEVRVLVAGARIRDWHSQGLRVPKTALDDLCAALGEHERATGHFMRTDAQRAADTNHTKTEAER